MQRRIARTRAFILVFEMSFHDDFNLNEAYEDIISFSDDEMPGVKLSNKQKTFINECINGVYDNIAQIDEIIELNCQGWTLERLNRIDIAILRLAVYENFYREDMQKSITINEAVELAKLYGSNESSGFINGLLGKALRDR